MIDDEKPPLDELVHFGIKGMQWGVRHKPAAGRGFTLKPGRSTGEIRLARKSVRKDAKAVNKEVLKRLVGKSSKEAVREKKLTFLTNPNRATAARMTRGETLAIALLATPATAALAVGGSQFQSRLITSRQKQGYLRPDGSGKLRRQFLNG